MGTWQFEGESTLPSAEQVNEEIQRELGRSAESDQAIARRVFEELLRAYASSQKSRGEGVA